MQSVHKHVLSNGLTILIYPVSTIPKVAVQLWYNVGSKDEKDGQRGLAHLLEHMVFKGTDILSESDINLISHKLSGNCNAFTSHDYTGYLFDFPKQNWHVSLPLLANCMRKCSFKEDLLNAELKAVIQELKMYKDDYYTSLCEEMISAIFADHPYHYPIIGYKQDLWDITRKGLLDFYYQHYIPNNATLVIVGDVDADQALLDAKKAFEDIKPDLTYKKEVYPTSKDLSSKSITMYRDIQQPMALWAWAIPGLRDSHSRIVADLVRWILGEGKGSILFKLLVDELELATDMQVDLYELFDGNILFIHVDPIDQNAIGQIEKVIKDELKKLMKDGITAAQLQRAKKQMQMENLLLFENNQKIANELGKLYLATGNELEIFNNDPEHISLAQVNEFIKTHLLWSRVNTGQLLAMEEGQIKDWLKIQEESDKQDEVILSRKVRESTVECGIYVEQIIAQEAVEFKYPHAKKEVLDNGLILLTHANSKTPKIDLILDLQVRSFYDPEDKQGLLNFMRHLLVEGTSSMNAQEFCDAAESRGISIDVGGGIITMSMLKQEFEYGLSLLAQIVTEASFDKKSIEKDRQQLFADVASYWDSPHEFAGQLIKDAIYKDHPYHKNSLGTVESIKKIGQKDLIEWYKKVVTPVGARLAVVGDLEGIDVKKTIESAFKGWTGSPLEDIPYTPIKSVEPRIINYPINRDQTVLCFAGASVKLLDKDYDALLLFDQIFTGGVLGSMSSYLFKIREQTGLFYTIGGSLIADAREQQGLVYIKTIVSNDRLEEAQKLIEHAIEHSKDLFTEQDVDHARNALVNTLVEYFETNYEMAKAFIFIDRFDLPVTYFADQLKTLKAIDVDQIKKAVEKVLDTKKLVTLRIGRF
jgi:zinc protease